MSLIPNLINASLERALVRVEQHADDGYELVNALLPLREQLEPHERTLRHGVTYSSMARLLRVLCEKDEIAIQLLGQSGVTDAGTERVLRGEVLSSSSALFTSWMSLVVMRTDSVLTICRRNPNRSKLLAGYLRLAGHDEVRRLRNALSHGAFSAEFQELEYWGGGQTERITFPNLNRLNNAMFALWTSAWAASMAPIGTRSVKEQEK